ncbi:MAG: hypothetical protein JWM19_1077 [Actinomycetia bacterium]|nr:hypothetical protein [Actinomycetes bacterium]
MVVHRAANWQAYAWVSRAVTCHATSASMISDALKARKKARRRAWLEDALTDISDGVHFPLERRWTRDVERAHGLPQATRQVRRTGADGVRLLDNLYEPYRISVELDGLAFHPPEQRHGDYYRDNETAIERGWDPKTLKPCRQACPVVPPHSRQPMIVRTNRGGNPDKSARS